MLVKPAVHDDRCRGDVRRPRRGQERDHRGHLVDVAGPPERISGSVLVERIRLVGAGHRCGDLARRDRHHGDRVLRELEGEHLRQHAEPGLCRTVRRGAETRNMLVHARHVDDASALSGLDHRLGSALGTQERAVEVGGEHLPPPVVAGREDGLALAGARIVDEDAKAAELADQVVDDSRRVRGRQVLLRDEAPRAPTRRPLPGSRALPSESE